MYAYACVGVDAIGGYQVPCSIILPYYLETGSYWIWDSPLFRKVGWPTSPVSILFLSVTIPTFLSFGSALFMGAKALNSGFHDCIVVLLATELSPQTPNSTFRVATPACPVRLLQLLFSQTPSTSQQVYLEALLLASSFQH